jgi:hypothetical protein
MSILRCALLLALVAACMGAPSPAEKEVLIRAVSSYNTALRQAYHDANLAYMSPHVTEKELNRLFPVLQALRSSGNRMVAIQEEFQVLRVRLRGRKAQVETTERWLYWWESLSTGRISKPKQSIRYRIRYHLRKEDGRWKVHFLEALPGP